MSAMEPDVQRLMDAYLLLIDDDDFLKRAGLSSIPFPKMIGRGNYGGVFDIGGGKIIKITTDGSEARTSTNLKGKNLRGVWKVYNVLESSPTNAFHDMLKGLSIIVGEHLDRKQARASAAMKWMDKHSYSFNVDYNKEFLEEVLDTANAEIKGTLLKDVTELAYGYYSLNKLSIKWLDNHEENIMFRGDNAVWIDIGLSQSPSKKIEMFENEITESIETTEKMDASKHTKWFKTLEKHGEVYFVGGSVRDELLGKVSKDIDLVVRLIPLEKIEKLLQPFGKTVMNSVGGKIAVIKFRPNGESEVIDIAIPRTEVKTGPGHKDFEINADPNITILQDLERRDFTINAITKDVDGKLFDPFGGQEDLKKKIIRAVSVKSFSEDPLRMLRAIQFASRFGFKIEPTTMKMIKDTASEIEHIKGECIPTELEKIVSKGNPVIALNLLQETGLFKEIFNRNFKGNPSDFTHIRTMGEFIACMLRGYDDASDFYLSRFKGDKETAKEIQALTMAFEADPNGKGEARYLASKMYALSPVSITSKVIPNTIKSACHDIQGAYPKGLKDLKINGGNLTHMGLRGQEIGKALDLSLRAVYDDRVENTKDNLTTYITEIMKL
jgi:tRNA nucleotidyltransferase/poly(A) polymerase